MRNLVERLEKRGWKKKEIIKTVGIIKNAKKNAEHVAFLDKKIYWVLLLVIIAANFAISVALVPVLVALNGALLYFVIITLGIVFGLLFELVIRSIEHFEKKHHLALAILIPLIALVNIFFITRISNNLASMLDLKNAHSPVMVSLVYAASFVLPYIIYRFVLKIEYYAKE